MWYKQISRYIYNTDNSLEDKTLYVALQNGKYYIHVKEQEFEERKYYSLVKTKDFVGEGANFVLMRYLALIKYTGTFELSTTYINGDMCRNIYVSINQ